MFIIRLLKKIPQTKEQTNRARGTYSPPHNSRRTPPSVATTVARSPSRCLFFQDSIVNRACRYIHETRRRASTSLPKYATNSRAGNVLRVIHINHRKSLRDYRRERRTARAVCRKSRDCGMFRGCCLTCRATSALIGRGIRRLSSP